MRPVLVTGGTGQVGAALARAAAATGVDVVAPGRSELALDDPRSIREVVGSRRWRAIVNCAAYTAVDRAEAEPALAFAVNAEAARHLAEAAAAQDVPIVQLSTDYVFDGAKGAPYDEEDATAPVNVYGASKAEGERLVRDANPSHIILRTAWVVSPWSRNFVKTMLKLASEHPEVRVVADQTGTPTSAADIAGAVRAILARIREDDTVFGTYHFTNAGVASWHALARHAVSRAQDRRGRATGEIVPIGSDAYPTPARRPASSRLAIDKVERVFGLAPRRWEVAVDEIVDALVPSAPADGGDAAR